VPLNDTGAPPVAAARGDEGGPLLHSASLGVVTDRGRSVELYDDCAGIAVDDLIEASIASGGCADGAIAAALVLPSLMPEQPAARSVVGFDRVVRAIVGAPAFQTRHRPLHGRARAAVDLIQLLTPHQPIAVDDDFDPDRVADALTRDHQMMLLLVKRAGDVAVVFPELGADLASSIADARDDQRARANRVHAWAAREARRAPAEAIRALLEGLFAVDCEEERRLREELGLFSVETVADMLAEE